MSEHGVSTEFLADWFWKRAGGRHRLIPNIDYAVMSALEVYVEEVAGLTTHTAVSHINNGNSANTAITQERQLRGCLFVNQSGAAIYVEKNDHETQKRFTIAHEAAHFILEVKQRQDRASSRLGQDFTAILHNLREATPTERIDAWLHKVPSDPLAHFMYRTPTGAHGCARSVEAECLADDLAIELLAPRSELIAATSAFGKMNFHDSLKTARTLAERRFGLPKNIARHYANSVVRRWKGGPSTAERFGFNSQRPSV